MKLPQLSLRELFLLIVIAAMGCGWWARERVQAKRIESLEDRFEAAKSLALHFAKEWDELRPEPSSEVNGWPDWQVFETPKRNR